MMKRQQKLYQNATAKEIIQSLKMYIKFFEEEVGKTPLALKAAIEYIYLHEEKDKNKCQEKEK